MRKTTTIKKCEECRKKMFLPFWQSKRQRFCSRICMGKRTRRATEIKHEKICIQCFKVFIGRDRKFCSKQCYWKSMSRGNKPNCIDCGKELSAHHCKRCKSCDDKSKFGENHWNWKEDRNSLAKRQERGDSAYRNWRLKVYKRDNYKCRINNCDCSGNIIAHHILPWSHYPELRYSINNGITLCQAHHPRKRAEEKRLIPFFQGLVPVSNKIF